MINPCSICSTFFDCGKNTTRISQNQQYQMVLRYSDLVTQWKEVSVNLHKSCTNYNKHIDERVCNFVSMTCRPL
ncbi:hypothetical protein PGT21_002025 [Puccinia graminis f. sp. tritici]|uniref:Uncharacterized protein n=1 Tax=Puccinia graminis f. sp. tritici TaxID=56615 RepID=A0A5B0PT01_PUCGR|nr:hypothetical protein PGTUg99_010471 [Puccinia graminis f. sp. tritici]KAA1103833.1 hypothetical protein PGT21_002025 [Puccinia graminis f. sp. tritici]